MAKKRKIFDIYPKGQKEQKPEGIEKRLEEEEEISEPISLEEMEKRIEGFLEKEEKEIIGEELPLDLKPLKRELNIPKQRNYQKGLAFLIFVLGLGVLYFLSITSFSKAEINIKRKREIQEINQEVLFDKNIKEINPEKLILPLNLYVFKEKSERKFESTGFGKDERKASGEVTIYNLTSYPQVLVANTRLETPDGKIFRINSRITIPGSVEENNKSIPGAITVKVTADQAGPDYNIGPCNPSTNCKFTIVGFKGTEKYDKFYAYSEKEMTGGAYGTIPLVTNDDLKKAEEVILKDILSLIEEDIKNKVPRELKIIEGAKSGFKLTKLESDAKAGDNRQFFNVNAEGEVMVAAFNEKDVKNLLVQIYQTKLPEQKTFCDDFELKYDLKEIDFKNGTMKLNVLGKVFLCQQISSSEIIRLVKQKNIKEVQKILSGYNEIEKIVLKITPFWVKVLPANEKKITVNID
jgi:hypothetical protein